MFVCVDVAQRTDGAYGITVAVHGAEVEDCSGLPRRRVGGALRAVGPRVCGVCGEQRRRCFVPVGAALRPACGPCLRVIVMSMVAVDSALCEAVGGSGHGWQ